MIPHANPPWIEIIPRWFWENFSNRSFHKISLVPTNDGYSSSLFQNQRKSQSGLLVDSSHLLYGATKILTFRPMPAFAKYVTCVLSSLRLLFVCTYMLTIYIADRRYRHHSSARIFLKWVPIFRYSFFWFDIPATTIVGCTCLGYKRGEYLA